MRGLDNWITGHDSEYLHEIADDGPVYPYEYAAGTYAESIDEVRHEWIHYGTLPTRRLGRAITSAELAAIAGGA
jgi:hypothetical protein